jgi:hypothetical protein
MPAAIIDLNIRTNVNQNYVFHCADAYKLLMVDVLPKTSIKSLFETNVIKHIIIAPWGNNWAIRLNNMHYH